jgi:hypothetical protein
LMPELQMSSEVSDELTGNRIFRLCRRILLPDSIAHPLWRKDL